MAKTQKKHIGFDIDCWTERLQPCPWYFENVLGFTKFFFHHKWNEAWLIIINWYIQVASRVATIERSELG